MPALKQTINYAEGIARSVVESERVVPVAETADVIVAGGGTAGFIAALAAARNGAKVIVIESNSYLGGVGTAVMMGAFVGSRWATGLSKEFLDRMADVGGAPRWDGRTDRTQTTPFDLETYKFVALDMLREAGVKLRFYSQVTDVIREGNTLKGVIVEDKAGRQAIVGKVVIDATGDADLVVRAGGQVTVGRESDGAMRPFALLFRLGGIDFGPLLQYAREHPDQIQPQHREGTLLDANGEPVISRISGFYDLVDQARERGELSSSCFYIRFEDCWPDRGIAVVNTTRIYGVDGTNPDDLTRGEIEGRKQIRQLAAFLEKYMPGCQKSFIIDVASRIGVRETRRIVGDYSVTDDDVYADQHFPDAIMTMKGRMPVRGQGNAVDVHMPDPIEGSRDDPLERDPYAVPREPHEYDLPYRILLPRGLENLLVAGRTIAVSHVIDGTTRNMLVVMRMGQVAGTAAALAVKAGVTPRALPYAQLRQTLAAQGMEFGADPSDVRQDPTLYPKHE
jgi:hypothetical protein